MYVCVCLSQAIWFFISGYVFHFFLSADCLLCLFRHTAALHFLSLCIPGSSNQSRLSSVLNPTFPRENDWLVLGQVSTASRVSKGSSCPQCVCWDPPARVGVGGILRGGMGLITKLTPRQVFVRGMKINLLSFRTYPVRII